jgi:hypothetical protein
MEKVRVSLPIFNAKAQRRGDAEQKILCGFASLRLCVEKFGFHL